MNLPSTWVAAYIGLPFAAKGRDRAGLDCWGLVRLVLAERFGCVLPIWTEGYDAIEPNPRTAAHLAACAQTMFRLAPCEAAPGDVLLFRIGGELAHVAVNIGEGKMLHIHEGVNACIERWQGPRWQPRLEGVYRTGEGA